MIEAAVVLSLLLLTIMSIISFAIYSHETFKEQMDLQKALLFEAIEKPLVFNLLSESSRMEGAPGGLFSGSFNKEYRQRLYIINEEVVLRTGEVIGKINNE